MTDRKAELRPWVWPDLDRIVVAATEFVSLTPEMTAPDIESDKQVTSAASAQERSEGSSLLAEAREQAQRLRREAWEEAAREARERFDRIIEEAVAEQIAAFETARDDLLGRIEAAAQRRLEEIEREVAALVAQMAAKVIRHSVEADDDLVVNVVRAALERAAGAKRITVHVAPADEPMVRAAQRELVAIVAGADRLEFVFDEDLERGDCVVETERGCFDARIQTQIEMLEAEVERALGGE